jgi:hypothetical protein
MKDGQLCLLSVFGVSALLLLGSGVGAGLILPLGEGHTHSMVPTQLSREATLPQQGLGSYRHSGGAVASVVTRASAPLPNLSAQTPPTPGETPDSPLSVTEVGQPSDVFCSEVGLPAGTDWVVQLSSLGTSAGGYCGGAGSAFNISLPPQVYQFAVPNVTAGDVLYLPTPGFGYVSTNASDAQIAVTFTAVPLQAWTFNETGLPDGFWWMVSITNRTTGQWFEKGSAAATLTVEVPDGTYEFEVPQAIGTTNVFLPSPQAGNVTLTGSGGAVNVTFAAQPTYELTFTESGLPAGTWWALGIYNSLSLLGWYIKNTTSDSISYLVASGTYVYEADWLTNLTAATLYAPEPNVGGVTVQGHSASATVAFRSIPGYSVTFVASGLPAGFVWGLSLIDYSTGVEARDYAPNSSLTFLIPNGTYRFFVTEWENRSVRLAPSPGQGNVSTNETSQTVDIDFVSYYAVSVNQSGLPPNATWFMNISGGPSLSGNGSEASLSVYLANGSYSLAVSTGDRTYAPSYHEVSLTVAGAPLTVQAVRFGVRSYSVEFTETGLPATSLSKYGWTVSLGGATVHSFTSSVAFAAVPNETLPVLITGPAGYRGPSLLSVNVSGPTAVPVPFTKGRTYSVAFAELGLPSDREWCVTLNDRTECGDGTALKFQNLSPDTYTGLGVNASGWTESSWVKYGSASPIPIGAAQSLSVPKHLRVTVVFGQAALVVFHETGLGFWYWQVTIDGSRWSVPWNGALILNLGPGAYRYTVGKEAGFRVSGGRIVLAGFPVSILIHFSSKGGSPTASPVVEVPRSRLGQQGRSRIASAPPRWIEGSPSLRVGGGVA